MEFSKISVTEYRNRIMKEIAFASRYGNADPNTTMHWPRSLLQTFNNAVASLLDDEAEAMKRGE